MLWFFYCYPAIMKAQHNYYRRNVCNFLKGRENVVGRHVPAINLHYDDNHLDSQNQSPFLSQ